MIKTTEFIQNATAEKVYDVLLSSEKHSKLTGDKANVTNRVGDSFSTFSGYAEGKNIELVPNEKIVQSWRASDWPENHFSEIIFELKDINDGVEINFYQTNLPEGSEEEFIAGWKDNYWEPLKKYFR